jgi:hypothetical protein
MIGKVIRGSNVGRLLCYLYGPGKSNEHTDPRLVAGFSDPADLEPRSRANGTRAFRRLTGLLAQPLAALARSGYPQPVWHCSVRSAPEDRMLSDHEWAQVAVRVMDRTGLAPAGDDLGVRWVAVRHAPDHIHIVATLARQDGDLPDTWNDFYRVREACQDAERRFGLRSTAPADRTAARRATRAETEQTIRRGWAETPRATLRREVSIAAAGSGTEQEFFAHLGQAGILVRKRYSMAHPGEITGYAVGLPRHTASDGGVVWYGGGKLAADLTLPKLRARWAGQTDESLHRGIPRQVARGLLRHKVLDAAAHARDEVGFFARLRETGVLVRLRFNEINPGQVTGYAVALVGRVGEDGAPLWYGGGRLAADLALPQLRADWSRRTRGSRWKPGTLRWAGSEREAFYWHAVRQAATAAEHVRHSARGHPTGAADTAWAAADALHSAARALDDPDLRLAADAYDRAARPPYGRIPPHTRSGAQLRATARLLVLIGNISGDDTLAVATLVASLLDLADAVTELRQAQQHAAQAAAARRAAEYLHRAHAHARSRAAQPDWAAGRPERAGRATAAATARSDFPVSLRLDEVLLDDPAVASTRHRPGPRAAPSRRAGPSP